IAAAGAGVPLHRHEQPAICRTGLGNGGLEPGVVIPVDWALEKLGDALRRKDVTRVGLADLAPGAPLSLDKAITAFSEAGFKTPMGLPVQGDSAVDKAEALGAAIRAIPQRRRPQAVIVLEGHVAAL